MGNSSYAMIVATPDLLHLRLLPQLVTRLEGHGLRIFAALPRILDARDVVHLYHGRTSHPRPAGGPKDSVWLAPRLFAAGPALALFLRSDEVLSNLQRHVARLKGASPMGASTGYELRALAATCDRTMSLVHAPDDSEALHVDLEVLFGHALIPALERSQARDLPGGLTACLGVPPLEDEREFSTVQGFCTVILRAVSLIAADPENEVPPQALEPVVAELEDARDRILPAAARPATALSSALRRVGPAMRDLHGALSRAHAPRDLRAYCRSIARLQLSRVLVDCCGQGAMDTAVSSLLARAMQAIGFPLDSWDEQRVHVTAAFHMDGELT